MERTNPIGDNSYQSALAYVSPKEEWPCCDKPRDHPGCTEVCVALKKGIMCGGGEREKKVRWGEKSKKGGCVYIVDEIPKGNVGVFKCDPDIEHEPALKEKQKSCYVQICSKH
jgi:hypothetical protein